jgi:DNA polymerase III subunit epsilon
LREECERVLSGYGGGFAVVDLEATGSSSRRHRVVEVAVVLLGADLAPQGDFCTLIDPEGPVGASHIHGIEGCHLGDAPRFAEIAPRLLGLLRGRVLVGHNVGCDRAFLITEYARVGVAFPDVPEVCTMRMATQRYPAQAGFSLRACAEAAGMPDWSAHTALGDAWATARLFAMYVRELSPKRAYPDAALARAAALDWPRMPGQGAGPDVDRAAGAGAGPENVGRGNERMAGSKRWLAGSVGSRIRRTAVRGLPEGAPNKNVPVSGMVSPVRDGGA